MTTNGTGMLPGNGEGVAAEQPKERKDRRSLLLFLLLPLLLGGICLWSLFANVTLSSAESFIPAGLHSSELANYSPRRAAEPDSRPAHQHHRRRDPGSRSGGAGLGAAGHRIGEEAGHPDPDRDPASGTAHPHPAADRHPDTRSSARDQRADRHAWPDRHARSEPDAYAHPDPLPHADRHHPGAWADGHQDQDADAHQDEHAGHSRFPTPCKVAPVLEINTPLDGSSFDWTDLLTGEAKAYDPDNVDPDTCLPIGDFVTDNGTGIAEVEFKIVYVDGFGAIVHEQDQFSELYLRIHRHAALPDLVVGPTLRVAGRHLDRLRRTRAAGARQGRRGRMERVGARALLLGRGSHAHPLADGHGFEHADTHDAYGGAVLGLRSLGLQPQRHGCLVDARQRRARCRYPVDHGGVEHCQATSRRSSWTAPTSGIAARSTNPANITGPWIGATRFLAPANSRIEIHLPESRGGRLLQHHRPSVTAAATWAIQGSPPEPDRARPVNC